MAQCLISHSTKFRLSTSKVTHKKLYAGSFDTGIRLFTAHKLGSSLQDRSWQYTETSFMTYFRVREPCRISIKWSYKGCLPVWDRVPWINFQVLEDWTVSVCRTLKDREDQRNSKISHLNHYMRCDKSDWDGINKRWALETTLHVFYKCGLQPATETVWGVKDSRMIDRVV